MKRLFAPLLSAAAAAALLSAPAGAELRQLRGFDGVRARDAIRVDVVSGDHLSVDVSGPEAGRVRTELDGRTLVISEINRPWFGHDRQLNATVRVTMPSVSGLTAARGATLIAEGIRANDMALAASMGGEIRVSGACSNTQVSVSMGGVVRANDFQCAHANIAASMGGDARVFASASFDASASMGGEVKVLGGGARGHVATSMGGEVSQE